ncbi:anaerobic dimethyl sulfoxide reductase subunit C [Gammaproteobacteria bacterium]|nr:anaerobic dimethyl sulfoxide reductase subunit C [Gammaproteobacteria bacterium]
MQQYGFFVDTAKCTGCKTCQLACKDYKQLGTDVNFRRVYEYAGGNWKNDDPDNLNTGQWQPDIFAYYLSIACNHCSKPACTAVCPTGAMHKRSDGFVIVDESICIGCRNCESACPYGAPQYDEHKGHMTKCDGCFERVKIGAMPICVESCPLRALDFGLIEDLRAKYGTKADIAPLPSSKYTLPNLVIKLNPKAKPTGFRSGYLANPSEV